MNFWRKSVFTGVCSGLTGAAGVAGYYKSVSLVLAAMASSDEGMNMAGGLSVLLGVASTCSIFLSAYLKDLQAQQSKQEKENRINFSTNYGTTSLIV